MIETTKHGANFTGLNEQIDINEALRIATEGTELCRVKLGSVGSSRLVQLSADHSRLKYTGKATCLPNSLKTGEFLKVGNYG